MPNSCFQAHGFQGNSPSKLKESAILFWRNKPLFIEDMEGIIYQKRGENAPGKSIYKSYRSKPSKSEQCCQQIEDGSS